MLACMYSDELCDDGQHGKQMRASNAREQLMYVAKGSVVARIGPRHLLLPGYALWLPVNTSYRLEVSGELDVLTFCDQGGGDFYRSVRLLLLPRVGREMMRQTRAWNLVETKSKAVSAFEESIRLMLPRWYSGGEGPFLPATDHPRLREITAHIRDRCGDPLTLQSLGRDFGLSRRSLNRLFASEMGLGFLTYLRTVRVIRALDLFRRRGVTVTETAYDVGYNSLCAFSNTFRELVGMRPRDYLRAMVGSRED